VPEGPGMGLLGLAAYGDGEEDDQSSSSSSSESEANDTNPPITSFF
jgi:hypothetical protein